MTDTRIAATYAQLLYEYLQKQGLDPEQVLEAPWPDAALHYVPLSDGQAWLRRVDALEKRPALGLRIAEGIGARHFGAVGYAALACATLGEALMRVERYQVSVYDVNPAKVSSSDEGIVIEWGVERGRPGALVDETAVASLVQLARDMTGRQWPMLSVCFVNPPPPSLAPYEAFFGCPVVFSSPVTRVAFSYASLALPLRKSDAALLALLDKQAEQLLQRVAKVSPLVQAMRSAMVPLIREGKTSLAALAQAHHTSPRSLQRRLAEQGTSFQQLLDNTRQHLAEGFLRDANLELAEIALLLGYSEQSAFTRAFRTWTGLAPAQWRRVQMKVAA